MATLEDDWLPLGRRPFNGEKFAQNIQGDPPEGPAREINQAADEAIKRFSFIDGTRQAAGGASGGHLANWLAVTTTRYTRRS